MYGSLAEEVMLITFNLRRKKQIGLQIVIDEIVTRFIYGNSTPEE